MVVQSIQTGAQESHNNMMNWTPQHAEGWQCYVIFTTTPLTYLQCFGSNVGSNCSLRRPGETSCRFVIPLAAMDTSLTPSFESGSQGTRMPAAAGKSSSSDSSARHTASAAARQSGQYLQADVVQHGTVSRQEKSKTHCRSRRGRLHLGLVHASQKLSS